MVCLRNISVDTLHKGDTEDDDDEDNNMVYVTFPPFSIIIIIIIIIVIILGISFMQGIYTYIPETNHFPRELCVAAILM